MDKQIPPLTGRNPARLIFREQFGGWGQFAGCNCFNDGRRCVHPVSGFIHFRQIKPNRSILAGGREPLDAESQGWAIAILCHLYGLLDELLSVGLKQFIEKNCGRIPAPFGLATRISALSFSKLRHVSKHLILP
jgi:hypothetical protein